MTAISARSASEIAGYAREELVAELGAAFLCADLGITPEIRDDHAAYLGHWLNVLKEDKRAIFSAAAHAQRAADFLKAGRTFPLVVAEIGDRACKGKYRCGETRAGGLFPRAQESGNAFSENKVP